MNAVECPDVAVLPTGAANIASVMAGLRRVGARPWILTSPAEVEAAEHLVLPGVGAFGAAMRRLHSEGWVAPLKARLEAERSTLAVCLGLQLLFASSDESPDTPGLGVLDGHVGRFEPGLRVPQLGWNRVEGPTRDPVLASGDAYFANSFRVRTVEETNGLRVAWTDHGGPFVAALARPGLLACQFHPELSGAFGARLLRRWLYGAEAAVARADGEPLAALTPRLIPCLDVKDGRVVKGIRFQGLRDAGDPVALATAYDAQGADELVLLDVSATPEGRGHGVRVVEEVRAAISIPLTVGGGVRTVEDAGRLLDAGADKVGVNTAAVADPDLLRRLADQFGTQCVVLALDAAKRKADRDDEGGWEVVVRSGRDRTGIDAIGWAATAQAKGAGEILLTSWDRDGTGAGYDLPLISGIRSAVDIPVIASGGAAHAQHLADALEAGADAVLAASIFHDGAATVHDVKAELRGAGVAMRGSER